MGVYEKFVSLNYKTHLLLSFVIRLGLIIYGIYHDEVSKVPYTDIDYKVFTDASRHILNHNSPYDRHTYRYSPLVALILIPNIILHHSFGKFLFTTIDLFVALLIRLIVKNTLKEYECYKEKVFKSIQFNDNQKKLTSSQKSRRKSKNKHLKNQARNEIDSTADQSMLVWLYNPMTIAIATRGNCDSISGFLVLLTLYFLQCKRQYFVTGFVHGIAIHFRLYPLIYSLTLYMFLSKFSYYTTEDRRLKTNYMAIENYTNTVKQLKNSDNMRKISLREDNNMIAEDNKKIIERKTIFKKKYLLYLIPNFDQIKLIAGCLLSLCSLTALFYHFYGYKFLFETYIFHLIRKDPRHNFSVYFYLQYLTAWVKNIGLWQKVLMVLPQIVLLLVFSCRYGLNKYSLNFSILTQTIVMVIYNSVLTSQYFVWIMAILPLCLWQINMPKKTAVLLLIIWFAAQGAWLLPAYFLEFHGQNTFLFIWIQSVSFFCANIAILGRLIMYFVPIKQKSL